MGRDFSSGVIVGLPDSAITEHTVLGIKARLDSDPSAGEHGSGVWCTCASGERKLIRAEEVDALINRLHIIYVKPSSHHVDYVRDPAVPEGLRRGVSRIQP